MYGEREREREMCVYIYIYIYVYTHVYIYIYMYIVTVVLYTLHDMFTPMLMMTVMTIMGSADDVSVCTSHGFTLAPQARGYSARCDQAPCHVTVCYIIIYLMYHMISGIQCTMCSVLEVKDSA